MNCMTGATLPLWQYPSCQKVTITGLKMMWLWPGLVLCWFWVRIHIISITAPYHCQKLNSILSPTDKGGGLHRLLLKSPSLISSPPLRACEGRWTWNQRGGLELKLHEVHLVVKFSEAELARLRRTWLPSAPSVVLTQCQWRGCQVHRGRACEVRCTWQSLSWHWARVYDVHLLYQLDLM